MPYPKKATLLGAKAEAVFGSTMRQNADQYNSDYCIVESIVRSLCMVCACTVDKPHTTSMSARAADSNPMTHSMRVVESSPLALVSNQAMSCRRMA